MRNVKILLLLPKLKLSCTPGSPWKETICLWVQRHAELPTGPRLCLTLPFPRLPPIEIFAVKFLVRA